MQDYKTYLDFVLAMENRKEPQASLCICYIHLQRCVCVRVRGCMCLCMRPCVCVCGGGLPESLFCLCLGMVNKGV